jgi:hypothetical protein
MRGKKPISAAEPDPKTASFDELFHATARRVLKRHGVPDNRIDAEIERLRKAEPVFSGPRLDEILTTSPAGADKR